ncbi:hypothetical protein AB3N00_24765 [Paenibacillus xylanilyticus]
MDKKPKEKIVKSQAEITCFSERSCCQHNESCSGIFKILPNGTSIFERCGC